MTANVAQCCPLAVAHADKPLSSKPMSIYHIDKRYHTQVDRTDRVLEIAEAFGLGLDDKEFVVFDNNSIEVRQGDVVYITGESGSGKSTVLRELVVQMKTEGLNVADIDEVQFEDRPLIDQIGKSTTEGIDFMQLTGVNDANIWLRKPQQLSDGQRYRFRLAKLIESGANVWVADEFLAVLDRTTAVNVAFNMQKVARRVGATLIVATTHDDMETDLAPSLKITKRYREKVEVKRTYAKARSGSFGMAIEALLQGERVTRPALGKDAWLALQVGYEISPENARDGAAKGRADEGAELISILPHIDKHDSCGSILVGWVPSQADIFALDWVVVSQN